MYLELLNLVKILFVIFSGIIFSYFLIQKLSSNRNIQFITVVKTITIYEIISFLVYVIYPQDFLTETLGNDLRILDFVLFTIILFSAFYFIIKKFFVISKKRVTILFLVLVFIFLPLSNFMGEMLVIKNIIKSPPFNKEVLEIENNFSNLSLFEIVSESYHEPFLLKTTNTIENGTISWPWNSLSLIMATQDFSKIRIEKPTPL